MEMIDSHAHLDFDSFENDLEAVILRAWEAGLTHIVGIGSGRGTEGAADAVALAAREPRIYATVGVHPHEADLGMEFPNDPRDPVEAERLDAWTGIQRKVLARMSALARHPRVVAIGEVGLDFHYDHSPREIQKELFRAFVRLAIARKLPLVIHSREAERETVRILREEEAQKAGGVIHCYGGGALLAETARELDFSLGIAGPITFKKADKLRQVVAGLPLESLLTETDCPYLAPVPHRGKRNEPAYVVEVVKAIAGLKGLDPREVGKATAANARRLFGIDEIEQAGPGRIVYPLKNALYINLTNRCTLACVFCLKRRGHEIAGMNLALKTEPSAEEVIAALQSQLAAARYPEVVFCGIGEPLVRLDTVKRVCRFLNQAGLRARVNTDGLASLVHRRDVPAELAGLVQAVNVSLNAPDKHTYARLCPSAHGEAAFGAVCDFILRCNQVRPPIAVEATAVDLEGVDLEATRQLATSLGAAFRVRGHFGKVGEEWPLDNCTAGR